MRGIVGPHPGQRRHHDAIAQVQVAHADGREQGLGNAAGHVSSGTGLRFSIGQLTLNARGSGLATKGYVVVKFDGFEPRVNVLARFGVLPNILAKAGNCLRIGSNMDDRIRLSKINFRG
jgi:hypothetical protein